MAKTPISAPLGRESDDDTYPLGNVADFLGAIVWKATTAERDKIPLEMRPGCVCIVTADHKGYKWSGSQWDEYYFPGGLILADTDGAIPTLIHSLIFDDSFAIKSAGDVGAGALISLSDAIKQAIAKKVTPDVVKKNDAMHGGESVLSGHTIAPPDVHRHRETSIGILGYFADEQILPGATAFTWLDNWVFDDTFVNLDRRDKTIQLNSPSVSIEDTQFLVALFVQFKGQATDDMSATVTLIDGDTDTVLNDMGGTAMQQSVQLQTGQPIPPVMIAGIVHVHDLKKIKIQILNRSQAPLEIGDRIEAVSGFLAQELAPGHAGGLPLLTAQSDLGKRFAVSHRYMGVGFDAMSYRMAPHSSLTRYGEAEHGGEYEGDGWALFVSNKDILASSSRDTGLRIKNFDDPAKRQDFSLWCLCKKIYGEELELLRQSGSTVTATVTTDQVSGTFKMRAIKYVGDVANVTSCPITGYSDFNVSYAEGYSQLVDGTYTNIDGRTPVGETVKFSIPVDADAIIICFGQNDEFEEPYDITIKDIVLDANPAAIKWEVEVVDK